MSSSEQDVRSHREEQVLERQSSSDSSKKVQQSSPSRGRGKEGRGPPKGRQSSFPRSPTPSTTRITSDTKMPLSYNRIQLIDGRLYLLTINAHLQNSEKSIYLSITLRYKRICFKGKKNARTEESKGRERRRRGKEKATKRKETGKEKARKRKGKENKKKTLGKGQEEESKGNGKFATMCRILDTIAGWLAVVGTLKDATIEIIELVKGNSDEPSSRFKRAMMEILSDVLADAADPITLGKYGTKNSVTVGGGGGGVSKTKTVTSTGRIEKKKKKKEDTAKHELSNLGKGTNNDPKRGHHVINNGVIRTYRDIVEDFIENHPHHFDNRGYNYLRENGFLRSNLDYKANSPLKGVEYEIEQMVAHYKAKKEDENASQFGEQKRRLLQACWDIIEHIFNQLSGHHDGTQVEAQQIEEILMGGEHMSNVRSKVEDMNQGPSQDGVFVDQEAKNIWLREGSSSRRSQFERCRDEVRTMFQNLIRHGDGAGPVLYEMAAELYNVHLQVYPLQPVEE